MLSAAAEFQGLSLGDRRLDLRAVIMVEELEQHPDSSLPAVFAAPSQLEAAYRLIENDRVSPEDLLAPHQRRTAARCAERDAVLVLHDTTTCGFGGGARAGMGVVDPGGKPGFYLHPSLCVALDGEPLGVIRTFAWSRSGEVAGKIPQQISQYNPDRESLRWNEAVHEADEAIRYAPEAKASSPLPIHVMDREADCLELLADMKAHGRSFVVRGKTNRRVVPGRGPSGTKLFGEVARMQCKAEREVLIVRRKQSPTAPATPKRQRKPRLTWGETRTAKLEIRALSTTIYGANGQHAHVPEEGLAINVVQVQEVDPPPGVAPVCWHLLTDLPIDTTEEAELIVDCYRHRWLIEEFFKAIKTGCAFEDHQFDHGDRYMRMLAIYLPIAGTMLRARWLDRNRGSDDASLLLNDDELGALRAHLHQKRKKLPARPTIREVMSAVARLGGHLPQNGPPGWLILSRGFTRLADLTQGFLAAKAWFHGPPDVPQKM